MALTGTHSANDTGHVADHNDIDEAILQNQVDITALQATVSAQVELERTTVPESVEPTGGVVGVADTASASDHVHPQGIHNHLDTYNGALLTQSATHESADTDAGLTSIHHTLGESAYQAAPGDHTHQITSVATSERPSAVSAGEGAIIYDNTLKLPIFSDGTVWKNFAGATV